MNAPRASFASDNNAGIHPDIFSAIGRANAGHVRGYGDDLFTDAARDVMRGHLGDGCAVFFVFNGTGANVSALQALMPGHGAVICAETAHINVDECGAPERFTGGKLLDVPTPDGKLTVEMVAAHIHGVGDQHHSQPSVLSLTQSTEMGTLYTPDETRALCDFAHAHGLRVHMDGARISNAAAALGLPLRAVSRDCGVDVLTFGGTKNGMLGGEAVVFFDPALAQSFPFIRKQSMQLASKMRFIAAQFSALLSDDLWLRNATHANAMARRLADLVRNIPGVRITQEVQVNAVFATIPGHLIAPLQARHFFYVWNEATHEVRWMTAFDTRAEDVDAFAATLREALSFTKSTP